MTGRFPQPWHGCTTSSPRQVWATATLPGLAQGRVAERRDYATRVALLEATSGRVHRRACGGRDILDELVAHLHGRATDAIGGLEGRDDSWSSHPERDLVCRLVVFAKGRVVGRMLPRRERLAKSFHRSDLEEQHHDEVQGWGRHGRAPADSSEPRFRLTA